MTKKYFGTDWIRGTVNKGNINGEMFFKFGLAAGTFFKNPMICLDGDVSGQKTALRAAERLFSLMRPDFNIYFITLPENLDPDSYIN